jgi:hypothetical protein
MILKYVIHKPLTVRLPDKSERETGIAARGKEGFI